MNNKDKSLIISSYDDIHNPYYAGGGALAILQVAKRLTKKYNVTVITGKYPGSKNETIEGIVYERVGTSLFGGKLGQLAFQLYLPALVVKKSYDVWIESFTPPFSTTCLQLYTKKPVIGLVHMLSGEDMKRKYKLPFDSIEKVGLQTYKHIIVLSENMKKKIATINPKIDITVIPNGVDGPEQSASKNKKKYILFIGRIEVDQKGLDLLLKAYKKFSEKFSYPLYIAGSGERVEETKLHKLIKELELSKKVTLLGRVTGAKKEQIYKDALFVVSTSRFETFPIVALEAMSHGVAFICFSIEGMSWIPDKIAKKVTPFSIEKLTEAMVQLAYNKNIADDMIKSGKEFVKQFTWDSVASKYDEYLTHILK